MTGVLIITIIMCICLISSIFLKPSIKIGNIELGTYWMIALIGAIFLILFKTISLNEVIEGLITNSSINPIKILILFLSMTYMSIFLDEIGMFKYCASIVLKKAGKSQLKLFLYLYVIVAILTVFTSNDIIILSFTPFICYFAKNAEINPIPFLFTEFVAANTWSMMFIIGNPTNIYLGTSNNIDFISYFKVMAIPTIMGGIIAMIILFLIFRKQLLTPLVQSDNNYQIKDKRLLAIGIGHLLICTILLVISSYIGMEMWLISFCFLLSLFIISNIYLNVKKKGLSLLVKCFKRMPWELIPFVISMFVFVLCIDKVGLSKDLSYLLENGNCIMTYGISSFIASNLLNNIPMSVLFSSVVSNLNEANLLKGVFATIVGSNIGAFFTPVGALAGIMWTKILKRHNVKFNFFTYIKYGAIISIPTLIITLVGLMIVL